VATEFHCLVSLFYLIVCTNTPTPVTYKKNLT